MEEQHSDCTGESGDTYLLETRRQKRGIRQLFLQTATDHSLTLKAKANQSFRFTPSDTGGEREIKQRQYRIQRSGNTALHQQESHFMDFTATEGHESNAVTRFSNEPSNCISINNVEIMQATTRAIMSHALGHKLHW